ncbi:MAG TPA: SURF1 family protein [Asticcacaulis sp.]|nr:SURF1 family protein [Asticcacaulis sp.]
MTLSAFFRAAPRGLTVAVAIAFVLLCGLGTWQMFRLQWKEHLIADMARTEAMPPIPAADALAQAKPAWRSVSLPACSPDPTHLILMHSEKDGTPGYRVLTDCALAAGQPQMLVDLGFVKDKSTIDLLGFVPIGRLRPLEKAGAFTPVNRAADNDWYWRSAADMGAAWHTPLRSDYFLVLDLVASHVAAPDLQQGQLTAPLPNRHLEYALTWYGLAGALIGVFTAFVLQKERAGRKA